MSLAGIVIHRASIAVRALASPSGPVVADLQVADSVSGLHALFHRRTGVHGFVDLKPGPRVLHVRDPAGRWLPVDVEAEAPDRTINPPQSLEVIVFPTLALSIPPGETVVWGTVTVGGQPAPLAFVQVADGTSTWRGATDAAGHYVVWLRSLPFTEGAPDPGVTVTVAPALAPGRALHEAHATVAVGSPDFLARFGAPHDLSTTIPVRRRTRVDLSIP